MNPELGLADLVSSLDRDTRADLLNRQYVELLELKWHLISEGLDGIVPTKFRELVDNLSIQAASTIRYVTGGKRSNLQPLTENHKCEEYKITPGYSVGDILVLKLNDELTIHRIVDVTSKNYLCERGDLEIDDNDKYVVVFKKEKKIKIGKKVIIGRIVFHGIEELNSNLDTHSNSIKRAKLKIMLQILEEKLTLIWSKYLPYK